MHITPPADDYGLQRIKRLNSRHEVKETEKVDACPGIESSEEGHEPRQPRFSERRHQRRRKHGRRLLKCKSLINSRNLYERRSALRREEQKRATTVDNDSALHGFDDFA